MTWKTRVDFTPTHFNTANFPARDNWLTDVQWISATHIPKTGERTVIVNELHYTVQGTTGSRVRRCFVVNTYIDSNMKPILLAAFPGSSIPAGDGAKDLWAYPAGAPDYEFNWPLEVVRDNGVFAVLIDVPRYGMNSYIPTNPYDPMIDAVSGIDAALWYLNNVPLYRTWPNCPLKMPVIKNILLGGQSYGANTTEFMCGVLKDAEAAYISGATIDKATTQFATTPFPPEWCPPDWTTPDWNYSDMLKASTVKRTMITFGWDNHGVGLPSDYARTSTFWTEASIDVVGNGLATYNPSRFEYNVFTTAPTVQGHEINLPHCRAWFTARVNDLLAGTHCFDLAKF